MKDTIGRENRKHADKTCRECGNIFRPRKKTSYYCSRPCAWANNGTGNRKQETWWTNQRGYVEGRIWLPNGVQIRVKQHRFVMEGVLGRPLNPWEDVHHIDGNKSNNSVENLVVILHGKHTTLSNKTRMRTKGHKLNITPEERKLRSLRAIRQQLSKLGRAFKAETKLKPKI